MNVYVRWLFLSHLANRFFFSGSFYEADFWTDGAGTAGEMVRLPLQRMCSRRFSFFIRVRDFSDSWDFHLFPTGCDSCFRVVGSIVVSFFPLVNEAKNSGWLFGTPFFRTWGFRVCTFCIQ